MISTTRDLQQLGFIYDKDKDQWIHNGNIEIHEDFKPNVNIFIKGIIWVDGSVLTKNLKAKRCIVSGTLSCTKLDSIYGVIGNTLFSSGNIFIKKRLTISGNLDATNILVKNRLFVEGTVYALSIKAKKICIKGEIDCNKIENL